VYTRENLFYACSYIWGKERDYKMVSSVFSWQRLEGDLGTRKCSIEPYYLQTHMCRLYCGSLENKTPAVILEPVSYFLYKRVGGGTGVMNCHCYCVHNYPSVMDLFTKLPILLFIQASFYPYCMHPVVMQMCRKLPISLRTVMLLLRSCAGNYQSCCQQLSPS
jgi:hypothetical protein